MVSQTCPLRFIGCAVLLLVSVSIAYAQESPTAKPPQVEVVIDGSMLSIDGTPLPLPASRKDLVKILGEPTRVSQLANNMLTWDELGLYATEDPTSEKLIAFTIALDKRDYKYWPSKPFSGRLHVDGASVTATSVVQDVNRAKKGKQFEKNNLSADSWVFRYDDIAVHLVAADPKHKSEKANFSYLQIGVRFK